MVVPVQDQDGNIENFGGYYPELAYCSSVLSPCNGKIPCINTCGCPRNNQMLLPSGECQDISEEVSKQLTNNYGLDMEGKINSRMISIRDYVFSRDIQL